MVKEPLMIIFSWFQTGFPGMMYSIALATVFFQACLRNTKKIPEKNSSEGWI